MEALKTNTTVKNRQVIVDLPDYFEDEEVEVIILSATTDVERKHVQKNVFLEFLRNGPTLSDEEIQRIDEVKKEFQTWMLKGF